MTIEQKIALRGLHVSGRISHACPTTIASGILRVARVATRPRANSALSGHVMARSFVRSDHRILTHHRCELGQMAY